MGRYGGDGSAGLTDHDHIALIVARFNSEITERLADGCIARLGELGALSANIETVEVPGVFEIPLTAQWALAHGFDAVVAIGAVIRGDTPHFEYVSRGVTEGCMRVQLDSGKPVAFCVLTCDTGKQAYERAGGAHGHKGEEAAHVVAEMLARRRQFAPRN